MTLLNVLNLSMIPAALKFLEVPGEKEKSAETNDFNTFGGDKRDRTADLLNAMSAIHEQNEF